MRWARREEGAGAMTLTPASNWAKEINIAV